MKTITVYGSSQVSPYHRAYKDSVCIGQALARAGYTVMSGGYFGVMEAISKGAKMGGRPCRWRNHRSDRPAIQCSAKQLPGRNCQLR